jgi:hypothetical protein
MRYHQLGLAAAVAALAVAAAGVSAAATVVTGRSGERTAVAASSSPGRPKSVLLINGDIVSAPTGGASTLPSTVTTSGSGLAGSVVTLGLGGKAYQVPAAALPYLGKGLDPGLFQISSLLQTENAGRLPVQVAYQGSLPVLPGITIIKAGDGAATGYLTADSARQFGAALIGQYLSDHSRGSYGTDGIFRHGTTISLAGTAPLRVPAGRAAGPAYSMHTLTVKGINLAGRPDTGDVALVFNADDSLLFDDPVETTNDFYDGTAKFSVPAGHYWAIGDFTDVAQNGTATSERLDVLPQFTVSGETSVQLTERAASSMITMITPRPAVVAGTELELRRPSATGPTVYLSWLETGAIPLWVSPTRNRPTVGGLQSFTDQWLGSPPGLPTPYVYDLAYQALGGTIPDQRYLVRAGGLATVHMNYYSDQPASNGWTHPYGAFTTQFDDYLSGPDIPTTMPGHWTEYMTGSKSLIWSNYIYSSWASRAQNSGYVKDSLRVVLPGEQATENWNAYPLHPAVDYNLLGPAGLPAGAASSLSFLLTTPSASRAGDTLSLDVTPFSDSQPGHTGNGFFPQYGASISGSYEIDENGKAIARGNALNSGFGGTEFVTNVGLSPGPATIRFELTAALAGTDYPLSTASTTVWTWRSAHEAGIRVPADWNCGDVLAGALVSRDCRVEPLMTLGYDVAGMALNGSAPAGRQVLHLTVGHLQLSKAAPVKGATVQVSADDGKTWHDATVSGQAGQYTAVYSAPAGSYVTLRVSASDAAGGQITETITRAYQIAA